MVITIEYIGAEWCRSCKTIFPQIESLSKKFSVRLHAKEFDVDLQENEKGTVNKLPTVRIYKDSAMVAEYSANQVASVQTWLQENAATIQDAEF